MDIRAFVGHRRPQLALVLRTVAAAIAALGIALWLALPLPLWAVLTAVIVTQVSVGRSLQTATDYFIGTIGGAIYGSIVSTLLTPASELTVLLALALILAPLAYVAALYPRFTVAPITGILVLLLPAITHTSPVVSAIDRVIEVAVGGATGLVVSLVVLPSTAHSLFAANTARLLEMVAKALDLLLGPKAHEVDADAVYRAQLGIADAVTALLAIAGEADHERQAGLGTKPHPGPLLRTLMRLRHDLVMLARVVGEPLPDVFAARLEAPLAAVRDAFGGYLLACGDALLQRRPPPPLAAVQSAADAFSAESAALRREGLTASLSGNAAERFYAIGFVIEQMHLHIGDLGRCVGEWAESVKPARAGIS